jgi:oligopeptidase B
MANGYDRHHKALHRLGGNPTLIAGYGAYGLSSHPTFTPSFFSLIDRGFVYAIAHVRGGHEKGERWYAEGRVLNKRNTFTDFIAATELLIAEGYTDGRAGERFSGNLIAIGVVVETTELILRTTH